MNQSLRPTVFISYSHDSERHKLWVLEFAAKLQKDGGVKVIIDVVNYERKMNWNTFMLKGISESDFVLIICTNGYKKRAEDINGEFGVSKETIINLSFFYEAPEKFIPIVREYKESKKSYVPIYLKNFDFYDFSRDELFSSEFENLIHELWGIKRYTLPEPNEKPNITPHAISVKTPKTLSEMLQKIEANCKKITIEFELIFGSNGVGNHYVIPTVSDKPEFEYDNTTKSNNLYDELTTFLEKEETKIWLLLGDYGCGKSTFCLKLCSDLAKNKFLFINQCFYPIYLSFRKSPNIYLNDIERWFNELLSSEYGTNVDSKFSWDFSINDLKKINEKKSILLILDGLDEISTTRSSAQNNYEIILTYLKSLNFKTLITSRINYFPSIQETKYRALQSSLSTILPPKIIKERPFLKVNHFLEFKDHDIKEYLTKSSRKKSFKAEKIIKLLRNKDIRKLATKPIFLNLLFNHVELYALDDKFNIKKLYEDIICGWVNTGRKTSILDKSKTLNFLEEIAFFMFVMDRKEISVNVLKKHLKSHFNDESLLKQIEHDIINCTFLVKFSESSYCFSHNTFIEFLVAQKLANEIRIYKNENFYIKLLTDPINQFLIHFLNEYDNEDYSLKIPSTKHMVYIKKNSKYNEIVNEDVDGFYIDAFPVTNLQYWEFLRANEEMIVPSSENRSLLKDLGLKENIDWYVADIDAYLKSCEKFCWNPVTREYPYGTENTPVSYVSYYDAWAFAKWHGKKIPTYFEWIKAASWDDKEGLFHDFDSFQAGVLESLNLDGINQGPIEVDSSKKNQNINGCYDMMANLCEWTSDYYSIDFNFKVIAGTAWHFSKTNLSILNKNKSFPNMRRNFIGFRTLWRDG